MRPADSQDASNAASHPGSTGLAARPPRLARRFGRLAVLLLLLAPGAGCTTLRGLGDQIAYFHPLNEVVAGVRARSHARQAWREHGAEFADQPHLDDFAEGFRAGYADVLRGEPGCPPPVPPRRYWRTKYENPAGREQVDAWYAGYPYGASSAEMNGEGLFRPIPARSQVARRRLPERLDPEEISDGPRTETPALLPPVRRRPTEPPLDDGPPAESPPAQLDPLDDPAPLPEPRPAAAPSDASSGPTDVESPAPRRTPSDLDSPPPPSTDSKP